MRSNVGQDATPPALHPYVHHLRNGGLILLTHVLNATNTWLLLRYLNVRLPRRGSSEVASGQSQGSAEGSFIVFASFLRSWDFWQDGSRRIGRDLLKARQAGDLTYIDGLTNLFIGSPPVSDGAEATSDFLSLTGTTASRLEGLIRKVVEIGRRSQPGRNVTVIIDGLDFLLASQIIDVSAIQNLVGYLRSADCSVILSVSADTPMIRSPQTPLEQDHVALLASLAHQASYTIGTRLLSTGAAKDVTGVLRITRGSDIIDEKELLYLVSGDGSVHVFERGSDSAS